METQQPCTKRQLDEIAFNLYIDCGRNLAETARQSGVARSTLRARINRHSRRLSAQEHRERTAEVLEHLDRIGVADTWCLPNGGVGMTVKQAEWIAEKLREVRWEGR